MCVCDRQFFQCRQFSNTIIEHLKRWRNQLNNRYLFKKASFFIRLIHLVKQNKRETFQNFFSSFRQGDGMNPSYFQQQQQHQQQQQQQQQNIYEINEESFHRTESPAPSPRFGSLRRRRRIVSRDYSEDTSEGSDGRTSSDEYDSTKKLDENNNNQKNNRKNSHFAFSNVKKKITSTFQRRHSVALHPPSPSLSKKQIPLRRSSTANHSPNHSPRLLRQPSVDDHHPVVQKRKTSLRRHATMAAVRLHEQNQVTGSNPLLNRILQKSQFQLELSSSTPDIKSHLERSDQLKKFKVHILGSQSVGKTGKHFAA